MAHTRQKTPKHALPDHEEDGYTLRFDWSVMGTREEMQYSEFPPANRSAQ